MTHSCSHHRHHCLMRRPCPATPPHAHFHTIFKKTHIHEKRPTKRYKDLHIRKRPICIKKDLHICKETYICSFPYEIWRLLIHVRVMDCWHVKSLVRHDSCCSVLQSHDSMRIYHTHRVLQCHNSIIYITCICWYVIYISRCIYISHDAYIYLTMHIYISRCIYITYVSYVMCTHPNANRMAQNLEIISKTFATNQNSAYGMHD